MHAIRGVPPAGSDEAAHLGPSISTFQRSAIKNGASLPSPMKRRPRSGSQTGFAP